MLKTKVEKWEEDLEKLIKEAFSDGYVECELRLSDIEVDYIRKRYRDATFQPTTDKKDGKIWFIVNLCNY